MMTDGRNNKSGLLGRKLEAVIVDSEPDQRSIPAAEYLKNEEGDDVKRWALAGTV